MLGIAVTLSWVRRKADGRIVPTMIDRLDIQNFKSFNGRHEVELAPITLVFGPNSSGKSTLLQSLAVLKQTLEPVRARLDLREPPLALHGELVDLGSFPATVNQHDRDKELYIGVRFRDRRNRPRKRILAQRPLYAGLGFGYDEDRRTVEQRRCVLGDDDAKVTFVPASKTAKAMSSPFGSVAYRLERGSYQALQSLVKRHLADVAKPRQGKAREARLQTWLALQGRLNALIRSGRSLLWFREGFFPTVPDRGPWIEPNEMAAGVPPQLFDELWGVRTRALTELLLGLAYLGPLRDAPRRFQLLTNEVPTNVGASGEHTAMLLARDQKLQDEVSDWLEQLDIKYKLSVRRVGGDEVGVELGDLLATTLTDLHNGLAVTPQDVGFGISQLLPVIVQMLVGQRRTICVEQPEIHIHPGLQAKVGDLLIEAARPGRENQIIVETHSEHLMLRLQRRLREGTHKWLTPDQIAVIYVDLDDAGEAHARRLHLDDQGYFLDEWPQGFFAERLEELFGGAEVPPRKVSRAQGNA